MGIPSLKRRNRQMTVYSTLLTPDGGNLPFVPANQMTGIRAWDEALR